jgi:hypothetical protein
MNGEGAWLTAGFRSQHAFGHQVFRVNPALKNIR